MAGGSVTRYIGKYYEKVDSTGTRYIFARSVRLAKVTGAQTYYYHQDHLGSSTVMTDANGAVQEQTAYLPYGSIRTHTGPDISNYKFTGQELDPETGLYYYKARYYDSAIGRFISADPMVSDFTNPQSLNRYTYCLNNPLIYIDPSGFQNEALVDAFSSGLTDIEGIIAVMTSMFTAFDSGKVTNGRNQGAEQWITEYSKGYYLSSLDSSNYQIFWGLSASIFWGNYLGSKTVGEGSVFYSKESGVAPFSFLFWGSEPPPNNNQETALFAGAGGGPFFGAWFGNENSFEGLTYNLTIVLGPVGLTYSANDEGWGFNIALFGKGIGIGYFIYTTNTIMRPLRGKIYKKIV